MPLTTLFSVGFAKKTSETSGAELEAATAKRKKQDEDDREKIAARAAAAKKREEEPTNTGKKKLSMDYKFFVMLCRDTLVSAVLCELKKLCFRC